MKYIRFKGEPTIILFPDWMAHSDAAMGREVSSAGFVDTDNWRCYGESISLGVGANPASDDPILIATVYPKGLVVGA
ncbi:MAG: hypothetical protein OQL08_09020 [Gammaproteobacteria bacterium]|nr:hypothetical protein [Gammaproteobacteria bacterium]